MNNKAEVNVEQIIAAGVGLIITLFLISALPSILNPCTAEKAQITQLTQDKDYCLSQLKNQSELTEELTQQCNQRVENTTAECRADAEQKQIIINNYKSIFIIHYFSIVLSIFLSFNLFGGLFKFSINVENEKLQVLFGIIDWLWKVTKWVLFVVGVGVFLFTFIYLIFPHWF